jgi:hypothetical protein
LQNLKIGEKVLHILLFFESFPHSFIEFPKFPKEKVFEHISNPSFRMNNVSFFMSKKTTWIKYIRPGTNLDPRNEHFYAHCLCKTATLHGTMDIRYTTSLLKSEHQCFPSIEPGIKKQMLRWEQEKIDNAIGGSKDLASQESSGETSLLDNARNNLIIFQNSKDLSFSAVTSPEFRRLAISLIKLGQHNSTADPDLLFPPLSRQAFTEAHRQLAQRSAEETIKKLEHHTVSLCFDATRVGYSNYVVACLVNQSLMKPRFYTLSTKIHSQNDYANFASAVVLELLSKNIEVGSICTDGLQCQVNALNGLYKGFC